MIRPWTGLVSLSVPGRLPLRVLGPVVLSLTLIWGSHDLRQVLFRLLVCCRLDTHGNFDLYSCVYGSDPASWSFNHSLASRLAVCQYTDTARVEHPLDLGVGSRSWSSSLTRNHSTSIFTHSNWSTLTGLQFYVLHVLYRSFLLLCSQDYTHRTCSFPLRIFPALTIADPAVPWPLGPWAPLSASAAKWFPTRLLFRIFRPSNSFSRFVEVS